MKYMLWYMGKDKDTWQKQLKQALNYYEEKYGEPASILTSNTTALNNLSEFPLIEKKNICESYIGITSERVQSEG